MDTGELPVFQSQNGLILVLVGGSAAANASIFQSQNGLILVSLNCMS